MTTVSSEIRPVESRRKTREPLLPAGSLLSAVALAILAGILVAIWVLWYQHGWDYYLTPIGVRGYSKMHKALRPSGAIGNLLGIVGTLVMFSTLLYVARKRIRPLRKLGKMKGWLEFHVFCGLFGPILITFHTSFKFNGIISVAYWSMVLVVLSGFVGRYLYVRIPKTIRGQELSREEIEQRVRDLKAQLAETTLPVHLLLRIEEVEQDLAPKENRTFVQLIADGFRARRMLATLRKEIRHAGLSRELLHDALDVVHERAVLVRRIAHLKRTRQLFQMWHVFHQPLVWVMFLIFAIHLAVALYFGYTIFGR